MLILNSEQIKASITPLEVIEAVEKALLLQESGDFIMPDRMHIENGENVVLLMPAFVSDYFSTKLVSVFPGNKKSGQPSIYGSVILNDAHTGKPIAMMDGGMVTGLRTGALGALGVAYTSPKSTHSLGLMGAGFQGFHQVLFACMVRNIEYVTIYDPFNVNLQSFKSKLEELLPHIDFQVVKNSTDLIKHSEVIITATTSDTPVVPDNPELLVGKHFVGLGSFKPEMRELPDALIPLLDELIVDTDHAKMESGDVKIPLEKDLIKDEKIIRLGQIINKEKKIDENKTTFFKTVGMALFDLLTAQKIYEKAVEKGIGTDLDF